MRPFAPRGTDAPRFLAPTALSGSAYRGVDILDPFHHASPQPLGKLPLPAGPAPAAPRKISHLYELGLTCAAMSFHEAALDHLQNVTTRAPDHALAWRELARLLRLAGRDAEAETADCKAHALVGADTPWRNAEGERSPTRLERLDRKLKDRLEKTPEDERIVLLRDLLFADPLDVVAMRYLANEEEQADDLITATQMFERALALSPTYLAARADYATLLVTKREFLGALEQSEYLVAAKPNHVGHRLLRADAAMHAERFDEAIRLLEVLVKQEAKNQWVLNSYGKVLRMLGRREESVKAFRNLLTIAPENGAAYFGISELKASYLTPADVAAMRKLLANGVDDVDSRKCMAYALGQTLERARDYEGSFAAYAYGNNVCKEEIAGTPKAHDPVNFAERLDRVRKVFTAESIAARAIPPGRPVATTPIFVLGMPRAGSTLVEQILGSHSLVEPTRELPVVPAITKKIALSRALVTPDAYPDRVLEFDRAQLDAFGEECLSGIACY
ncbi:MAG TPA: sulfotransferase, partial [Acetobacteraceae bacterium]|nr:sulfotransferase [Acetobacteraceae bacterium]